MLETPALFILTSNYDSLTVSIDGTIDLTGICGCLAPYSLPCSWAAWGVVNMKLLSHLIEAAFLH